MAGVYHINGDSVSPCRAQKGQCPYGKGDQENHFDSPSKAMEALEERLSQEYGSVSSVSKKDAQPATAKELAAKGADAKEVRDALRRENPTWNDRRIHTVEKQMTQGSAGKASSPKAAAPASMQPSAHAIKAMHSTLGAAKEAREKAMADIQQVNKEEKLYDATYGAAEGRAYHYDYKAGAGKIPGPNPNGSTYYNRHPKWVEAREEARNKFEAARKVEKDAQTSIEEAGLGYTLPDEGNTIRVNTQAQKWLLENELKGQISDGMWENTNPQNHWEAWSNAKVIVDPQNPGRNFRAVKDNYQLNSKNLLEVVGDRMVDDVKKETGKDYGEKAMMKDLADLRKIFKTTRATIS